MVVKIQPGLIARAKGAIGVLMSVIAPIIGGGEYFTNDSTTNRYYSDDALSNPYFAVDQ